ILTVYTYLSMPTVYTYLSMPTICSYLSMPTVCTYLSILPLNGSRPGCLHRRA
ncbi:uncharacterized protein K441DRAFT_666764, partial [Cenococcum geophilum 1.58]|uniref:uncharacterized protein n=1 Tax=Cenococcum geophilum 1.58 TaxID=794803 RepID=UPI00358F07AE